MNDWDAEVSTDSDEKVIKLTDVRIGGLYMALKYMKVFPTDRLVIIASTATSPTPTDVIYPEQTFMVLDKTPETIQVLWKNRVSFLHPNNWTTVYSYV
jgi:hypothetical protein